MGNRFYDLSYHAFPQSDDITVVCPDCGRAGTVCFDRERGVAVFRCSGCFRRRETVPDGGHTFEITAQCSRTGRYFRATAPRGKVRGQRVWVRCPVCGELVLGEAAKGEAPRGVVLSDIRYGEDPYFHYPLYFQADYRGKTVWAQNRAHLQYLIDYLSAELRTVRPGFGRTYGTMRAQSDRLPAFMKTAKNREGMVKLLTRLQKKR